MPRPRSILRPLLILLLGTLSSLALAALGPISLPQPATTRYADHWMSRKRSWLTTRYASGVGNGEVTSSTITRVRTKEYDLTPEQHRMDDIASWYVGDGTSCTILDSGFPFRSLSTWQVDFTGWIHNASTPRIEHAGFLNLDPPNTSTSSHHRWIPYLPLWPGLIANALIWSASFWLLSLTPTLLRHRRTRKGQCPYCAYDLRATPPSQPCPECGRSITPRG